MKKTWVSATFLSAGGGKRYAGTPCGKLGSQKPLQGHCGSVGV